MNWKKWVSKQVRGGDAGCWISNLLRRLGKCKEAKCGGQTGQAVAVQGSARQTLVTGRGESMSVTNTQAVKLLDEVLAKLDGAIGGSGAVLADAIDREIAGSPRQTAVMRLRGSEAVTRFREELETQSLTVTTVTAFLQMLQQVLPGLLAR